MSGDEGGSVTCWLGNLREGDLAAGEVARFVLHPERSEGTLPPPRLCRECHAEERSDEASR